MNRINESSIDKLGAKLILKNVFFFFAKIFLFLKTNK